MHLSIKSFEKTRTFTACFGSEGPLKSCGPELKTKLHDAFEPFSTSYHALLVNRVSEIKKLKYLLVTILKAVLIRVSEMN